MPTFKEAFGAQYNEARQTGDVEGFRDFVKSQTSNSNIAKALGLSSSAITSRMKNPIVIMKLVAENANTEVVISKARGAQAITIDSLPETI